jgi:hypothetical protein
MADPFKLAVTLPPFLFESQKAEALAPKISATYTPKEYADAVSIKAQHNNMLEKLNRAVMSGRDSLISSAVAEHFDTLTAYHQKNIANIPQLPAQPLVGRTITSSLQAKTQKLMSEE